MTEQTIVSVFQQDHQAIDRALEQYRSLKHFNFQEAKDSFKRFWTGLQRHIVWEEQLLFPVWERKSGLTGGGPTQVMRLEHRRIADLLNAIHEKVQARNTDGGRRATTGRAAGLSQYERGTHPLPGD
jgi:iron-sulfur cluster repair protein YtfE (RIC family)